MYTIRGQFIQLSRQFYYMNQVAQKRQLFEQGKEATRRTVLCSPWVVPATARVNFYQGEADPANSFPRFSFSFYIARDFDAKIMCPLKFESEHIIPSTGTKSPVPQLKGRRAYLECT
jgi:hypothetical protein